jgi:hypothetical protein
VILFGDVFVKMDSVGILNRGHVSGYLYCAPAAPTTDVRYAPCSERRVSGKHAYDPQTRDAACQYQQVDERWYAYEEGPG